MLVGRDDLPMHPQSIEPKSGRSGSVRIRLMIAAAVAVAVALLAMGGNPLGQRTARAYPSRPLAPEPEPVLLAPPPVDDEFFPCEDCHEGEPADPMVRELDEHDHIQLEHGDLWCLDCHDRDQRDLLHLSDTTPVEMSESWRLCTRCHAKKIPDWRAGVHGKRTGYWSGPKEYRTCVVCHDPHAPLFKPITPKPPPIPARDINLTIVEQAAEANHEGR